MKYILTIVLLFSLLHPSVAQSVKEKEVWARVEALSKAVFGTKDSVAIKDLTAGKLLTGIPAAT